MKKLLVIYFLLIAVCALKAQTCSPSAPCVQLTITDSAAAATVTTATNANGQQIESSGPIQVNLWKCTGVQAGQCDLPHFQNNSNGFWHAIPVFTMTSTTKLYDDQEPAGSLMNYIATWQFTGSLGGVVSAPSAIFQLQVVVPSLQTAPPVGTLNGSVVTTGNTGVQ